MRWIMVVMVTVLVAGCTQKPASVKDYSGTFFSKKGPERRPVLKPGERVITVQRGDSLYGLARRYDTEARALIEANGLRPPYRLNTGQKLRIPGARFYVTRPGDTLYSVSRKYGVDMSRLARINRLDKPYVLEVGQRLRIPNQNYAVKQEVKVASAPKQEKVVKRTNINKPKKITNKPKRNFARQAKKPAPKPKYTISKRPGDFSWPVKGKIVSAFGAKKGGVYNDGINIATKAGQNVRAAASGTVVYTGSELKGYGNLLILRHDGGWLTAYAHQKKIAVRKGTRVKKGQVIGSVGATGNVKKPQLHFAIRKGRQAVNPLKYLSG